MFLAYAIINNNENISIQTNNPIKNKYREKIAYEAGRIYAREYINKLNAILIEQGRYDDLKRSTLDMEFQSRLLNELVIEQKNNQ
jgi:hypothetical protein